MGRLFAILFVVAIVVVGGTIGVLGRSWLDRQGQSPAQQAAAAPTAPPPPTAQAGSRDTVLEISEGELQAQVNTMLVGRSLGGTPLGDATIQSATVALRDRQIKVTGNARAGVLNAPYTTVGTVTPDGNGRPLVRITEASVGGVALPDSARTALADSLQTQVDRLFSDRSMKVRTIEIADGKMRIVGTAGG